MTASSSHAVAALHDAMLDDAHWSASGLIGAACRTKGNALVFGERRTEDDACIFMARFYFRGQRRSDWEKEYFTVYHLLDERAAGLSRRPPGARHRALHRQGVQGLAARHAGGSRDA